MCWPARLYGIVDDLSQIGPELHTVGCNEDNSAQPHRLYAESLKAPIITGNTASIEKDDT